MGQTSSTHRNGEESSRRDNRRFSQLFPDNEMHPELENTSPGRGEGSQRASISSVNSTTVSASSNSRNYTNPQSPQSFASFRRHISSQPISSRGLAGAGNRNSAVQDEILYEQEERLLVGMDDLSMPHTPVTHITASPLSRRPSVVSRIFSRGGTIEMNDNGEQPESPRHRTLRRRSVRSSSAVASDADNEGATRRPFSMIMPLSPPSFPGTRRSRPRQRVPTPHPMSIDEERNLQIENERDPSPIPVAESSASGARRRLLSGESSVATRQSRMERVRRSISSPLDLLFNSNSRHHDDEPESSLNSRRPQGTPIADETDHLIPPLTPLDPSGWWDDTSPRPSNQQDRNNEPAELPAWNPRWMDRASSTRREARRVPNVLRGRSSRLIRRDDEAPLSRILQLAATAIAAQLSGTPNGGAQMTPVADDGLDGSLATFMETLNNATTTNTGTTLGDNRAVSTLPPLNFLRVFRFVNGAAQQLPSSSTSTRRDTPRALPSSDNADSNEDGTDGRTVTLVVVGVRSVPSSSLNRGDALAESIEPNLDALLNLPLGSLNSNPSPLRSGPGNFLRSASGRSRFTHRRRASMGGVNPFPERYESQRHNRMHSSSRPVSGDTTPVAATSIPLVLSESPPGPHPPPSTPADLERSAVTSTATTPSRRPSSASAAQQPFSMSEVTHDADPSSPSSPSAIELDATQTVRQRRRSDSEFARHRDLGAGAARRNGVVEPDNAPTQGRSWLIYVVGTNLSEDHPAFATPSLFTDNPTYEDMLLLSSLLGPAKPPVASREDVASALGVYRIQRQGGALVALALESTDADGSSMRIPIAVGERCLVCLADYEIDEEVRKIEKCKHVFHRECIDEWLTTGRNSCPLCRGQGIDEKSANVNLASSSATTVPSRVPDAELADGIERSMARD
ncbi:hypothetical protein MMC25_000658 [Agyrium rufum]|nr:hypothetical protein [Agyrium rufum]